MSESELSFRIPNYPKMGNLPQVKKHFIERTNVPPFYESNKKPIVIKIFVRERLYKICKLVANEKMSIKSYFKMCLHFELITSTFCFQRFFLLKNGI